MNPLHFKIRKKKKDDGISTFSILSILKSMKPYSVLLFICVGIVEFLFIYLGLFHTDVDSARYFISALIQSQAAIISIVISLTLIAAQLVAAEYSPRVIDVFKKNPDTWILLSYYIIAISYGFIVLKLIDDSVNSKIIQNLANYPVVSLGNFYLSYEYFITFEFILGIFTICSLFIYLLNIIELLKYENFVEKLTYEVNTKNILDNEGPLQYYFDVLYCMIRKSDLTTIRVGLNRLYSRMKAILREIHSIDIKDEIIKNYCDRINRCYSLAKNSQDEEIINELNHNLFLLGKFIIAYPQINGIRIIIASLTNIGTYSAESNLKHSSYNTARVVRKISEEIFNRNHIKMKNISIESLSQICFVSIEHGDRRSTLLIIGGFRTIGLIEIEKNETNEFQFLISGISKIAERIAEKNEEKIFSSIIKIFEKFGDAILESDKTLPKPFLIQIIVDKFSIIGQAAISHRMETSISRIGVALEKITFSAEEKHVGHFSRYTPFVLINLSKMAIAKNLHGSTMRLLWAIISIGQNALERNHISQANVAIKYLFDFSKDHNKLVEDTFERYGPLVKKEKEMFFNQFNEMYQNYEG